MKKEKFQINKFFALMGCVAFIVMIALAIGLIIEITNGFINNVGVWPVISNFLNILAVLTLGTGITTLFFANSVDSCDSKCFYENNE